MPLLRTPDGRLILVRSSSIERTTNDRQVECHLEPRSQGSQGSATKPGSSLPTIKLDLLKSLAKLRHSRSISKRLLKESQATLRSRSLLYLKKRIGLRRASSAIGLVANKCKNKPGIELLLDNSSPSGIAGNLTPSVPKLSLLNAAVPHLNRDCCGAFEQIHLAKNAVSDEQHVRSCTNAFEPCSSGRQLPRCSFSESTRKLPARSSRRHSLAAVTAMTSDAD